VSPPVTHPRGPATGDADLLPRTLRLAGELDLATLSEVHHACVTGAGDLIVDLSNVSFMDCSAYGGLMSAAAELRSGNGSLTVVNPAGQPAFLLALIAEMFEIKAAAVCATHPSGGALWQA
jgi:anti-anti-sigma factor